MRSTHAIRFSRIVLAIAVSLFILLVWRPAAEAGEKAGERPNIVIILVDDQGYYDLGCYGAMEVETPQIDRLAAEGVRFTVPPACFRFPRCFERIGSK